MLRFKFLFVVLFPLFHYGQNIYYPLDTADVYLRKTLTQKFLNNKKKTIKQFKDLSGKDRKTIKSILNDQYDVLIGMVSEGKFYLNRGINKYFNRILQNIIDNNPSVKNRNFKIYLGRNFSANAFSVGDGTIVIHLEILRLIENEDQLAFLTAHELAHEILNHRNNSFRDYFSYIRSKKFKEKVKEIRHKRYGKQDLAENLLEQMIYSFRHKSRKHEIEADSMAIVLLRNTQYNLKEASRFLIALKNAEEEHDTLTEHTLRKWFDIPTQPFNEDWLQGEDFSHYHYFDIDKRDADSLKTHPAINERVELLKNMISKDKSHTKSYAISHSSLQKFKQIAPYEHILNLYRFQRYGIGLYETLIALDKQPDNPFLLKIFFLYLEKLSKSKENLTFNHYVPTINPNKHSKAQQRFINLITNISLKEMKHLIQYYHNKITDTKIVFKKQIL